MATTTATALAAASAVYAADPWADQVVSYSAGTNPEFGYENFNAAIGSPSRITGASHGFPAPVTPFAAAWPNDEVVSVGAGGHLTVRFDEPIRDLASNAFGVDVLIFGNAFFADLPDFSGVVTGLYEDGPFMVSVSKDGHVFVPLGQQFREGLFPTLSYLDLNGPYDPQPGSVPSDYTRPVNPAITMNDLMGRTFAEVVALYAGSGGGIPVDINSSGMSEISYLRIDVAADVEFAPEFDGFAAVPEPSSSAIAIAGALIFRRRRGG
ncbi:MAG: hypothetical protein JNG88_01455 [Phycisphaerales bacterium]|nr:hypothetical protein [Phycisphaerales bacterium]